MLPSEIELHGGIYPVHAFVIVGIVQGPKPFIHHPESPAIVLDGQLRKRLPDRLVITRTGLVIVHRTMGAKELTGLPNTDLMLLMRIGDQLSLFSRP